MLRTVPGTAIYWRNALLVVLCCLFVAVLYIMIEFIRADDATNDFDFTMYKNSHFKECAARITDVNCTLVMTTDFDRDIDGHRYLNQLQALAPSLPSNHSPNKRWCNIVSCFREFKVIPSSPLQSAFGVELLSLWLNLITVTVSWLWASRRLFLGATCDGDRCKGYDWQDWLLTFWDIATFCFWWYSFFTLVKDPRNISPISLFAWLTTWRTAAGVRCHPFACRFNIKSGFGRKFVWSMAAIAFTHFAATWYAFVVKYPDWFFYRDSYTGVKYGCLENDIPRASGISRCSPQLLCSKDWLFTYPRGPLGTDGLGAHLASFLFFLLSLGFVCQPFFRRLLSNVGEVDKLTNWGSYNVAMLFPSAGFVVYTIAIGALIVSYRIEVWPRHDRDAQITFDVDCQAVHVALSSWSYFLDVARLNRDWRIARIWFNA